MRSTQQKNSMSKTIKIILPLFIIVLLVFIGFYVKNQFGTNQSSNKSSEENNSIDDEERNENDKKTEDEQNVTKISISAAGDIMFHDDQLESAYDEQNDTYDFTSVFADVEPIFSKADLALANFETTMAGPDEGEGYRGYPTFNSPDETIDAIKTSGINILTTANNHALDTGSEGLKRTVEIIRDKGLTSVGTYDEAPDSRVHMEDVKGIKIAILSYTEMINDLGLQTTNDDLSDMINLMDEDLIKEDIEEAKSLDADLIISFVHWGEEYVEELTDSQEKFADLMTEEGVDIILGSHPHIIQPSGFLEVDGNQSYIIYSMGNFVSNQRLETVDNELTEDGVIVNLDIEKDHETSETTVENVDYVPTWVYRDKEEDDSTYTYRILPVEDFLNQSEIPDKFKERMENSRDETVSKMGDDLIKGD